MELRPGYVAVRVNGGRSVEVLLGEAGGHRWQRVPPTEKRGRVHTSTITVAVLEEPGEHELVIAPRDIEEKFKVGTGSGGQHRNKTATAVQLWHRPSGILVTLNGGRSQHANRQMAMQLLRARLNAALCERLDRERNERRRGQVGSGMRGDKIRTVQVRHGTVTDHRTGRRTTYSRYSRGYLRDLR